jgi:hypothetical protein
MEKNSNTLMLYQMNPPKCEPHFNVVFEDQMLNCIMGRENFFYSIVVFLFMMKTRLSEITKKLNLDDFVHSIIKY